MGKPKSYLVPILPDGRVPNYVGDGRQFWDGSKNVEVEWVKPEPFEASLVLSGMERGRSAAHFIFTWVRAGLPDRDLVVFMTDLYDMVRDPRWRQGLITATFIATKRGNNYGTRLHVPDASAAFKLGGDKP